MNKKNLYENSLKDLVVYYAKCVEAASLPANMVGTDMHTPSQVMDVILDKFNPRLR